MKREWASTGVGRLPTSPGCRYTDCARGGGASGYEHVAADFETDMQALIATALQHHEEKPFDVVHAQYCYPTGLAALEISSRLNIPNVVSIQGGDGHWVGLCCQTHHEAMQAVLNHSMALVIGCQSFADEVVENHGILAGATDHCARCHER